MGSVRPQSHWKARQTVYLTGRIISPLKRILLIFFSAQPQGRFNSRPLGPETPGKTQYQLKVLINYEDPEGMSGLHFSI
jgi:hypothetical protein